MNWNGYDYTRKCIESLLKISYHNFNILLVDNASTDLSGKKLSEEFNNLIYFQNRENLGFTGGNNLGISYALEKGFDLIMLLNNDTEVEPDFLEHLVKSIEANKECGAVQPKILYWHDRKLIWNAGGVYNKWLGWPITVGLRKRDAKKFQQSRYVDWISGCCILLKSSVVRKVGLLDEKYFAYFEDVDWSIRIKAAGYSLLYQPKSTIYHIAGASGKSKIKNKEGYLNPIIHYYDIRNHLYLILKHSKNLIFAINIVFQIIKICSYCAYFILRGRWNKLHSAIRGFKDGLKLYRRDYSFERRN